MKSFAHTFEHPMVPAEFGYSAGGALAAISLALTLSGLLYLIH